MTPARAKCDRTPRLGAIVGGESQWRNRPPSTICRGARLPFPPTKDSSEEHAPRNDVYVVQETDALVRRTLMALAHLPVERPLEGAARERLRDLRLHLEEALAALGRIEQRGGLTDQGLAHRRAFRMLLAVPTQKREGGLR